MKHLSINVALESMELQALIDMAEVDCRHPREQMRFILREEARRRGLLSIESEEDRAQDDAPASVMRPIGVIQHE